MDKDSRCANRFIGFFYLFHMLVIAITLNWHDENFKDMLSSMFWITFSILFIEGLSQIRKWETKNEVTAFNLILKETTICIGMSLMSFFIVTYGLLIVLDGDDPLTKSVFNTLVSLVFLLNFVVYCLYHKYRIPEFIERLLYGLAKRAVPTIASELKNDVPNIVIKIYKEKVVKEKVSKFMDLITIFATVFLLSNSTFATINSQKLDLNSNPFNSLEFFLLVVLIPIYVQSAYHRTSLY